MRGDSSVAMQPTTPDRTEFRTEPAASSAMNALPLASAARRIGVSPTTLWRWARRGIRVADGTRVKLEYRRLGRRIVVDLAAIDRFSAALAAADTPPSESDTPSLAQRSAELREAARRADGI